MKREENCHLGHRQRIKNQFLTHGLDRFSDHQVLEILLFYAIPNGDTNPIAHRLIDRFGSLRGVLEAEIDELKEVNGIGDNAASLIKFSQLLSGRYLCSSSFEDNKTSRFADTDALRRYYEGVFLGMKDEQIRAMALDNDLHLVDEKLLIEGTIGKVELSARRIADFVIKRGCDRVVLAHNHPRSTEVPSKADLVATTELARLLNAFDIVMLDHIIVGVTGSLSIRSSKHARAVWPDKNPVNQANSAKEV